MIHFPQLYRKKRAPIAKIVHQAIQKNNYLLYRYSKQTIFKNGLIFIVFFLNKD